MSSTASSSSSSSTSSKKKRRLMILPHTDDLKDRLVASPKTYGDTTAKNPNNFYSPQPDEKGLHNGMAAPPPIQQRRRRLRHRQRQPQQPQYNHVMSKSSSSKKKKKKQRLMPGHNTNAEKGPRVAAAENEEYKYDTTARALLKKTGFDPEDINKRDSDGRTPMIYFCGDQEMGGNITMVRYLISRDADCRKTDSRSGFFPMYYAASGGHLEIMKLLARDGGAHEDVRKHNRNLVFTEVLARDLDPDVHEDIRRQQRRAWLSPLRIAFGNDGYFHVVQWLLRNEALSTVSGGDIDDAILRNDLNQDIDLPHGKRNHDHRLTVFLWARDVVTTHDNVLKLPLSLAKGKSDILELIAQYVAGTPSQIRTLRQLLNHLPAFISEVPFVEEQELDEEV